MAHITEFVLYNISFVETSTTETFCSGLVVWGFLRAFFYPQVSGKDLEAQARTRSCGAWLLDCKEPGGR